MSSGNVEVMVTKEDYGQSRGADGEVAALQRESPWMRGPIPKTCRQSRLESVATKYKSGLGLDMLQDKMGRRM